MHFCTYYRFLILREYLIPGFNRFASNRENIKFRNRKVFYSFIQFASFRKINARIQKPQNVTLAILRVYSHSRNLPQFFIICISGDFIIIISCFLYLCFYGPLLCAHWSSRLPFSRWILFQRSSGNCNVLHISPKHMSQISLTSIYCIIIRNDIK